MSTIIEQIEQQIAKLQSGTVKKNTGKIIYVADGVARIDGLSDCMYNEMIEFADGTVGIALGLGEDDVSCIILGDVSALKEGDEAKTTGRLLSVPVGRSLLGRVVDAIGNPIDGKGPIDSDELYPVEKIAPGIIVRQSVSHPLLTGIMSIDSMIPIGRGQRELIIGDRGTGKTTIAIDTIINQARINRAGLASGDKDFRPVYSIYVAIGQKNSNIARTVNALEKEGAMEFTTIIGAAAADNPANQYLAPYCGAAMGEWFMQNGMDALIVYDDLSKHAVAYRQISLVLKRPSGREAYPGDVFYLHSRLLERSSRINAAEVERLTNGAVKGKTGSLTALPIIETQAGDVSAFVPTNVISITDGQIFLESDLFNAGIRPAINAGLSVSRVGGAAQTKIIKKLGGGIRLALAQYRELAAFSQFASDLDDATRKQLERGKRATELMKQKQYSPLSVAEMAVSLFAVDQGYLDDIDNDKVVDFEHALHGYMGASHAALMDKINDTGDYNDEIESGLRAAVEDFKANGTW